MPKKNKEIEDRLQTIEYLLAGLLMKKEPNIKAVAKILGCSDNVLSALYPENRQKKSSKTLIEVSSPEPIATDAAETKTV